MSVVLNRIKRKILFYGPNKCTEWAGAKDTKGYPLITIYRKGKRTTQHASRALIEQLLEEKLPDYVIVCHTCDNPECLNPEHLFLGTHQDNAQDMINKGRASWQKEPVGPKRLRLYQELDNSIVVWSEKPCRQ
jgi:hypothetical protein